MENKNLQLLRHQVAEIQLTYRSNVKPSQRPKVNSSKDAFEIFSQSWDPNKIELMEQFKVMLLNRANKVLGIFDLSTGGVSGTVADPKLIFAAAIKANATSVILAHNHPSGNLKPSESDINLTLKVKEGGKLLEIAVLDHIIVTTEGHFSFADEGTTRINEAVRLIYSLNTDFGQNENRTNGENSSLSCEVGAAGFEPTTSTSRTWRATGLRYAPNNTLCLLF